MNLSIITIGTGSLLTTFFFIIILQNNLLAQQIVSDIKTTASVATNHSVNLSTYLIPQNSQYKSIQERNDNIMYKTALSLFIKEQNMKNKKDNSLVNKFGNQAYIYTLISDIAQYEKQIFEMSFDDPKLAAVMPSLQLQLADRILNATDYIQQAFNISDDNLLSQKDRMDLVTLAIQELKLARGLAYSILRRMKTAQRKGLIYVLSDGYNLSNRSNTKVDDILRNYKLTKGKKSSTLKDYYLTDTHYADEILSNYSIK